MAYIITRLCRDCVDTGCVAVCPVDCIYEYTGSDRETWPNQLYIHPDECIDCGACEPECPWQAIFEEVSGERMKYAYFRPGGLVWDVPDNFVERVRETLPYTKQGLKDIDGLMTDNEIFMARTRGVQLNAAGYDQRKSPRDTTAIATLGVSVCEPVEKSQSLNANRSPNCNANCALAACHATGGRFQFSVMCRRDSQISLVAA